eukprot:gene2368-biopygen8299
MWIATTSILIRGRRGAVCNVCGVCAAQVLLQRVTKVT